MSPRLAGLALALGLALWPAAPAKAERFRLELAGSPLASFAMTCFAENNGEQTRFRRREYLPQSYIIEADAILCRVTVLETRARLEARLLGEKGNLIAHIAQYAVFGQVTLRSAGSWGPAGASRGGGVFPRPER